MPQNNDFFNTYINNVISILKEDTTELPENFWKSYTAKGMIEYLEIDREDFQTISDVIVELDHSPLFVFDRIPNCNSNLLREETIIISLLTLAYNCQFMSNVLKQHDVEVTLVKIPDEIVNFVYTEVNLENTSINEYYKVKMLNSDFFIKLNGCLSSYDGATIDSMTFVEPKQVTVTIFE